MSLSFTGSPQRRTMLRAVATFGIYGTLISAGLETAIPRSTGWWHTSFILIHPRISAIVGALLIALITTGYWQPFSGMLAMFGKPTAGGRSRFLINVGLSIVLILVVSALVTSLYQSATGGKAGSNSLWRDPQIIALAIGLLLSVLFIDRWKSLEGKVDQLSSDQTERLKDIQENARDYTQLKVGQAIDKAEKLSAKLASTAEQNPWLEVITERDILVETESIRGILRTSYNLLNDGNHLHLFEYLEFCSRKGTDLDIRPKEKRAPLRGTPDDFLELATFCEVWLGDYALAAEFMTRCLEQNSSSAYLVYPDHIFKLLRIGNLPSAKLQMSRMERILQRKRLEEYLPFFETPYPVSARYCWHAKNASAVYNAFIGKYELAARLLKEAEDTSFSRQFADEQLLVNLQVLCSEGKFDDVFKKLELSENRHCSIHDLHERIVLYERLGKYARAAELRQRIKDKEAYVQGDDWQGSRTTRGPDERPAQTDSVEEAVSDHEVPRQGKDREEDATAAPEPLKDDAPPMGDEGRGR